MRNFFVVLSIGLAGCLPSQVSTSRSGIVPPSLFGRQQADADGFSPVNLPEASTEMSLRVDRVGRNVLAANANLGLKPQFAVIGTRKPELFHVGTSHIYMTSGLVERCRGDADIAALLSVQLAEMVADREMMAHPDIYGDQQPPIQVPAGNAGRGASPDQTDLVELARFEKSSPRRPGLIRRPNTQEMARKYLESSGFRPDDLDAIEPLVRAARQNVALEKHFKRNARRVP